MYINVRICMCVYVYIKWKYHLDIQHINRIYILKIYVIRVMFNETDVKLVLTIHK